MTTIEVRMKTNQWVTIWDKVKQIVAGSNKKQLTTKIYEMAIQILTVTFKYYFLQKRAKLVNSKSKTNSISIKKNLEGLRVFSTKSRTILNLFNPQSNKITIPNLLVVEVKQITLNTREINSFDFIYIFLPLFLLCLIIEKSFKKINFLKRRPLKKTKNTINLIEFRSFSSKLLRSHVFSARCVLGWILLEFLILKCYSLLKLPWGFPPFWLIAVMWNNTFCTLACMTPRLQSARFLGSRWFSKWRLLLWCSRRKQQTTWWLFQQQEEGWWYFQMLFSGRFRQERQWWQFCLNWQVFRRIQQFKGRTDLHQWQWLRIFWLVRWYHRGKRSWWPFRSFLINK